jgi:hypothetical protein
LINDELVRLALVVEAEYRNSPDVIDRPLLHQRKRVDNDVGNYLADLHGFLPGLIPE